MIAVALKGLAGRKVRALLTAKPFAAADGDALADVPGVTAASHVRYRKALVQGEETDVTGDDPATIDRVYHFEWTSGSAEAVRRLGTDGALVTKAYADDRHIAVGRSLALETRPARSGRWWFAGSTTRPRSISSCTTSASAGRRSTTPSRSRRNLYTFLEADSGADKALTPAADGFGDATLHTGNAFAEDYMKGFSSFLNILYVLLALSVVVSLFGMVNTLVPSVYERTRELGMLRTIGMTRRQARRMIRHESVITALIGAALGLPLGVFLAGLVTQALSKYDVSMSVPVPTLVAFTLVAALAGVAAAVLPARRASRLNVSTRSTTSDRPAPPRRSGGEAALAQRGAHPLET